MGIYSVSHFSQSCCIWFKTLYGSTSDWGGGTDYGVCGDAYLQKFKSGALRSLLKPYLYPNATSPTRLHGNTAVCHDHQSSQGTSVTVVDLVCVGPDENGHLIDELATWTRTACTLCFTMKLGGRGGMPLMLPGSAYVKRDG